MVSGSEEAGGETRRSSTHLLSELSDSRLNLDETELLDVPNDGGNKTLGGGDGDGKIDEVSVDDGVSS